MPDGVKRCSVKNGASKSNQTEQLYTVPPIRLAQYLLVFSQTFLDTELFLVSLEYLCTFIYVLGGTNG